VRVAFVHSRAIWKNRQSIVTGRNMFHCKGNKCNQRVDSCTANRLRTTLLSLLPAVIKRPEIKMTALEKCYSKHPLSTVGKSNHRFFTKISYCLPLPDSRQNFLIHCSLLFSHALFKKGELDS